MSQNTPKGFKVIKNEAIITLDELESDKSLDFLRSKTNLTSLVIRKNSFEGWVVYPPVAWYQQIEFQEPFWELPEVVTTLINLKTLILLDLDIKTLPNAIVNLKNLEKLNLSTNKLELTNELKKLEKLSKLKHLILYGNHYVEEEIITFQNKFENLKIEYKDNQEFD